jgi:hypothetical protein
MAPAASTLGSVIRIRTEEVGDRLFVRIVEQRGLGREEHPGEAGPSGRACIVLRTGGGTLEKRDVALRHLEVERYVWGLDFVSMNGLRQADGCEQSESVG